jgi:hypothetical protein
MFVDDRQLRWVGRDFVEPPRSLKFEVSSLKGEPGLKLETWDFRRLVRTLVPPLGAGGVVEM